MPGRSSGVFQGSRHRTCQSDCPGSGKRAGYLKAPFIDHLVACKVYGMIRGELGVKLSWLENGEIMNLKGVIPVLDSVDYECSYHDLQGREGNGRPSAIRPSRFGNMSPIASRLPRSSWSILLLPKRGLRNPGSRSRDFVPLKVTDPDSALMPKMSLAKGSIAWRKTAFWKTKHIEGAGSIPR